MRSRCARILIRRRWVTTFRDGKWERRHKFSDFGCTVCHDGQGRGLKMEYSHGNDEYWPDPLLGYVTQATWRKEFRPHLVGKEYLQAACAQCHTEENFSGTPLVEQGRKLFFKTNCYGCHKIEGLSEGTLGPDLTEAGRKYKIDYLWESIVDPTANLATSFMPKFHLNEGEVKALVIFLKSRRGMNFAETSIERYRASLNARRDNAVDTSEPAKTAAGLEAHGRQLIEDKACTACHKLEQKDGGIAPGPALRRPGARRAMGARSFQESAFPRAGLHHAFLPFWRGRFPGDDVLPGQPAHASGGHGSGGYLQGRSASAATARKAMAKVRSPGIWILIRATSPRPAS